MDTLNEPLIWTSKGNIPIAGLRYEVKWEDTPLYTKFTERYFLGDEIVKESAHVLAKKTEPLKAQQGSING